MTAVAELRSDEPADFDGHHAFISYHRTSSGLDAKALRSQLEAIARRSGVEPKLDIFLDEDDLVISGLEDTLKQEIEASRRLVVVLHADTKDSVWVDREIEHWLASGGTPDRLILVNVDPALRLRWNEAEDRFHDDDVLPRSLRTAFPEQPIWLDLRRRWNGRFDDATSHLGRLCATLLERDPADILQRELREERQRRVRLAGVLATVCVLLVAALVASAVAVASRNVARQRESEAIAQAKAAEALLVSAERPERAIELLTEASDQSSDRAVRSAIFAVLEQNRRLTGVLAPPASFDGQAPDDVVFSPSGRHLAGWRVSPASASSSETERPQTRTAFAVWDLETEAVLAEGTIDSGAVASEVTFLGEDRLVFCGSEGVEMLDLTRGRTPERETLVDGTDTCAVSPMQGGAFGLARRPGERSHVVLLSEDGERTTVEDVAMAAGRPYGDVVFLEPGSRGVQAFNAGGERVVSLAGLTHAESGDVLWYDGRGTIIMRADDGRVLRSAAFEPDPSARALGVPDHALAVDEIGPGGTDYLWLTSDSQLQWTLGAQSVDLTDIRWQDSSDTVETATPAIWNDGSFAVVAFARKAVLVELTSPTGEPTMTRLETVNIDASWAGRTTLMGSSERGQSAVILPTTDETVVMLGGPDRVEHVEGSAFFDPTGSVAVAFGDAPVRLFTEPPLASNELRAAGEELSTARDTRAAALSSTGDKLAVVRPASPVTVYSTQQASELPSLITDGSEAWQAVAGFGSRTVRATGGGQTITMETGEGDRVIDELDGRLNGLDTVRPDGLGAVVTAANGPSGLSTSGPVVVDETGDTRAVPDDCQVGVPTYRFLPGRSFRTDVDAAELQQLALVGSGDGETAEPRDVAQMPCMTRGQAPELADSDDVLDYQIDDEQGRIVARRTDGQIDVTTWQRGDPSSVASSVIPGTDEASSAGISADGDLVATWTDGASTISALRRDGTTWEESVTVQTSIGDIAAVVPDNAEEILTVVGKSGTIEAFGLESGQLLFRRELELSIPWFTAPPTVRWVATAEVDGAYVVHLGVGRAIGQVLSGHSVTVPLEIDTLHAHLCDIYSSATGCADHARS